MLRSTIRRFALMPPALVLIHFLGFTYAFIARPIRAAHTPYLFQSISYPSSLLETYLQYIQGILHGSLLRPLDQGPQQGSYAHIMGQALVASLGLLAIVLILSVLFGLILGFLAVKNQPPAVRGWLHFISTIGLSMPSFYVGSLSIILIIFVRIFVLTGLTINLFHI